MDKFLYVVNNTMFTRINKDKFVPDLAGGSTVVALETAVAKALAATGMFGKNHEGLLRTMLVSATTIPIQGGLTNPITKGKPLDAKSSYLESLKHGSAGILPMFIAQYIVESSAGSFFHLPHLQIGDLMMMAVVKLITPVIQSNIGFMIDKGGAAEKLVFGASKRIAECAANANIPKFG